MTTGRDLGGCESSLSGFAVTQSNSYKVVTDLVWSTTELRV